MKMQFTYNIFLIGFMGSGKSTVADYLCEKFDMDVVEMDQVIAERERMSISDIFEKHGELYFRDLETTFSGIAGEDQHSCLLRWWCCYARM